MIDRKVIFFNVMLKYFYSSERIAARAYFFLEAEDVVHYCINFHLVRLSFVWLGFRIVR